MNVPRKEITTPIGTHPHGRTLSSSLTLRITATSTKPNPKTLKPRDIALLLMETKLNPTTKSTANLPV
jgi:hypothetical protein